jgi:hypothetical protein
LKGLLLLVGHGCCEGGAIFGVVLEDNLGKSLMPVGLLLPASVCCGLVSTRGWIEAVPDIFALDNASNKLLAVGCIPPGVDMLVAERGTN